VALLAVTNAITAYKLYSRSGQAPAGASARTNDISDDSAESGSAVRAGVSHPKPASGGLGAAGSHEAAEPEPELPPAATLPVAEAQEWDAARFSKAQVVEARCSFNGKLYTFRTPGCTSFVKLPAEALPASMAQAPGETPDVFQITHATGEGEPLMDCKMQGGTSIQVRTGKKPGLEEDLLRHTATALAVAKRGDVEILYVCALPDNACRSLLTSLSAIPGALMIVTAVNAGSRNPMVMIPHSNPGSLRVKFRKSPKEAWSSTDPSSDLEIPSVGKVTFKFTSGPAGKWLAVSTEPDEEFSGLAKKCGPHPLPAAGDKTASPEQQHMLQLLGIAQGYSVRIEDAVGRKLAAFRLSLAIPRNNLPQD
jgi:hypothetical protein